MQDITNNDVPLWKEGEIGLGWMLTLKGNRQCAAINIQLSAMQLSGLRRVSPADYPAGMRGVQ
jgi:hypothetical protein